MNTFIQSDSLSTMTIYSTLSLKTKSKLNPKTKTKYESQQKQNNTPKKNESKQHKHLFQSTLIGLSNIILHHRLTLKFAQFTETPKSLHNIRITQIPDLDQFYENVIYNTKYKNEEMRENVIYNTISEMLQNEITQIALNNNYNENEMKKMFDEGRKQRQTKVEGSQPMKKYKTFGPLNEKGIEKFGQKVMKIIVYQKLGQMKDKQIFVELQKDDCDILNAFCEVLKNDEYLTEIGKDVFRNCFSQDNFNCLNQIEEINGSQTIQQSLSSDIQNIQYDQNDPNGLNGDQSVLKMEQIQNDQIETLIQQIRLPASPYQTSFKFRITNSNYKKNQRAIFYDINDNIIYF